MQKLDVSERKTCEALGINRNTQSYIPRKQDDEDELRKDIIRLARIIQDFIYSTHDGADRLGGLMFS